MATYLTLSRAARLAGVTRADIQDRIRHGEISTFEGAVAVEDLLRVYPLVSLSDDATLERVERIKTEAHPRLNASDSILPDPQVLVTRLRGLSETLANRISALDMTETLLDQLTSRLDELAELAVEQLPEALRDMRGWLDDARRQLKATPSADSHARLLAKDSLLRIVAANVKLIPSGHDFFVEGNESILDAAIRAGLMLSYGCSSGNCGTCKARLISGETWKIREHDYVISEREKAMGYILTCSQTAITDLTIEAAEAASVADLPQQAIHASVRKLEPISPNLIALNIQTPRTQTLRFMAGQRACLTLEGGAAREFPIASCPCNGRSLWFYVRRGADAFSARVFGRCRQGHPVTLQGPIGNFVLAEDAAEPAFFIALGDGIAPIKSLIEHAVSIDLIKSFRLYWDTTHPEGHHQQHWCRALGDALDDFRFVLMQSGDADQLLARLLGDRPELDTSRFYLAGPPEPTQQLSVLLRERGVTQAQIAVEQTDS